MLKPLFGGCGIRQHQHSAQSLGQPLPLWSEPHLPLYPRQSPYGLSGLPGLTNTNNHRVARGNRRHCRIFRPIQQQRSFDQGSSRFERDYDLQKRSFARQFSRSRSP